MKSVKMNKSIKLVILFGVLTTVSGQSSPRPHIIVILADDLGWNDVGWHGSNEIPTPNLDALAYNGVILNRHYVQPVCTPSRAALMTGYYPIHTAMQGNPIRPSERRGLPLQFKVMPEYFKDLGYRTHAIGKWHLGYYSRQYIPTRRGFDSFFGPYNGVTGYYDYMIHDPGRGEPHTAFDLYRNETAAWDVVGEYATDQFTKEATRLIENHRETEPFFLYLAYTAVHSSHKGKFLEAPQDRVNSLKYILEPNRRTYAAMLTKLDDGIGQIVKALSTKNMLSNTIILFMSDNGAPSSPKESLYPNWGSNYPLRGTKNTLWEGGVRSPTFVWTSQLHGPRVSDQLIHITDWLPTLYTAAGGSSFNLPQNLDGVDQWGSILWGTPSRRNEVLLNIDERKRVAGIIYRFRNVSPLKRTWKLVFGKSDGNYDGAFNNPKTKIDYGYQAVLNSPVYQALRTFPSYLRTEIEMRNIRRTATVSCPYLGVFDDSNAPDCSRSPCLFNLDVDPCERTDIAPNNSVIAEQLYKSLQVLHRTLLPQHFSGLDRPDYPSARPTRFNNTWSPWVPFDYALPAQLVASPSSKMEFF